MGQYHYICNLTKKEYIDPRTFDAGLKMLEQVHSKMTAALFLLLCCSNERGGGDAPLTDKTAPLLGRWAGDRVAVVGDYAEDTDFVAQPGDTPISEIFGACFKGQDWVDISHLISPGLEEALNC
jgi:hypothetical protein